MYNHIVRGRIKGMCEYIFVLLAEIDALGWPSAWLSRALRAIPRRHSTHFVRACRLIGRALKHNDFRTLLCIVRPFEGMRDTSVSVFAHILKESQPHDPSNPHTTDSSSAGSSCSSSSSNSSSSSRC